MILDVWIQANLAGVLTAKANETAERARIPRDGFTRLASPPWSTRGDQGHSTPAPALPHGAGSLESYVTRTGVGRMFEDEFYKEMFPTPRLGCR